MHWGDEYLEKKVKAQILDGPAMHRALVRMAHEMIEQLEPLDQVILVGVRRRGIPIAERLSALIERYEGIRIPVGEVDISMYRDDLTQISESPGRQLSWWTMCCSLDARQGLPWRRLLTWADLLRSAWRF